MIDKLKKLNQTLFKKTNFKAFFFFLLFSVFIWIMVQFGKNYQQVIEIPVTFINSPKDKIVEKKKANFRIRLDEKGFQLAWFGISRPAIQIDLTTLPSDKKALYVNLAEKRFDFENELGLDFDKVTFLDKTIRIPYEQKFVKKVAVVPVVDIDYAPGYSSSQKISFKPDSIRISGKAKAMNAIKEVKTLPLKLKDVKDTLRGNLIIDTNRDDVTYYKTKIDYSIPVEKFTEGKVSVPVVIENAPQGAVITILPKRITVIFKVSLANYESIAGSDFKVVCDFKGIDENQSFLIPKLMIKPNTVISTRLNVNKVQFVIKK